MTATEHTSSAGAWNRWYELVEHPAPFGPTTTYQMAADWVADCDTVSDWGCGKGWLRRYIPADRYIGIDGSRSPFADVVADLTTYRCEVDGIVLRHVLEHEYLWRKVLDNAVASARRRLVVVLFTPLADAETHEIVFAEDPGVPDLSFYLPDLVGPICDAGFDVEVETLHTSTQYGTETVLRCQR